MSDQPNNNQLNEKIRKDIRRRYTVMVVLFFIPVLVILYNVFFIQFVEGDAWNKEAFKDRQEDRAVSANRGNILSCDGELMASTVPSYQLLMDFKSVDKDTFLHYLNPLSYQLSEKLKDKSPSEYRRYMLKGFTKQHSAWTLSRIKITYIDLMEIKKFPLFNKGRYKSGLYYKKFLQRKKPFGSLASRTIGDIYGDFGKGGKNGLELRYDSLLRGQPGRCVHRKIAGKYIDVNEVNPVDGIDLMTTIDVHFQDIAETALCRELTSINATSGTVVLMEVATGEVKAICNLGLLPSGAYGETRNFAVSDQSEPGSTFKIFSMMVGLEDGLIHPDDPVDTQQGCVKIHGRNMNDHNKDKNGYGLIDAKKSIWNSSNIGVSLLIEKHYRQDEMKFVNGLRRLGFDRPMNLEIPGAGKPRIPYPGCPGWSKVSLPWMSIGYVATIPPIYTLAMYNGIANNGKLIRPFFVKGFYRNGKMLQEFQTTVLKEKMCSDRTLSQIRAMLDSVVSCGTGKAASSLVVSIAGKTGTAQIAKGILGYRGGGVSHQVSFCGFFPADRPKYSAIVVIREPKIGYASGGKMAGGVFKEMAEKIYAREFRLQPGKKMPIDQQTKPDSLRTPALLYPVTKGGQTQNLTTVLKALNVPCLMSTGHGSLWVEARSNDSGVLLTSKEITERLVPDVLHMGARDAVYLLGKMGMNVTLSGRGKVISQSLSPGSFILKGQRIELILE
jgi:cell division protein FtsI (penicillin-binding protein 3)